MMQCYSFDLTSYLDLESVLGNLTQEPADGRLV